MPSSIVHYSVVKIVFADVYNSLYFKLVLVYVVYPLFVMSYLSQDDNLFKIEQ